MSIDKPKSVAELRKGLRTNEKSSTFKSGSRTGNAKDFLMKIEKVAPLLGITRIADISGFTPIGFPVNQSCRPYLYSHTDYGQNTGSQGKGESVIQSKISSIMETLDNFSAEPRNAWLIRGSYGRLKKVHKIANPNKLINHFGKVKINENEEIMWTKALSLNLDVELLIPAELVFLPFFPADYKTRSHFMDSSHGLASGSTYLDACIAGIYESIERYFIWQWRTNRDVVCKALFEQNYSTYWTEQFAKQYPEYELQLFTLFLKTRPNIPMIVCCLLGQERSFIGYGCHLDPAKAVNSAVAEALQSMATVVSGAREDIGSKTFSKKIYEPELPKFRSLSKKDFEKKFSRKKFRTLNEELQYLLTWLNRFGFKNVYAANLCRTGIEIPVVKIIIPGMKYKTDFFRTQFDDTSISAIQLGYKSIKGSV